MKGVFPLVSVVSVCGFGSVGRFYGDQFFSPFLGRFLHLAPWSQRFLIVFCSLFCSSAGFWVLCGNRFSDRLLLPQHTHSIPSARRLAPTSTCPTTTTCTCRWWNSPTIYRGHLFQVTFIWVPPGNWPLPGHCRSSRAHSPGDLLTYGSLRSTLLV